MSALFEPVTVAGMRLRNRTVMAPMTRKKSPGGVPGEDVRSYYLRRARGEVGMVISEGLAIDHPAAIHNPDIPTTSSRLRRF